MIKKLFKYYKPYKATLGFALGGAMLVAVLELLFPMCLRYIMQELLPQKNIPQLLQAAGLMAVAYLITCAISYKSSVLGRTVAAKIEQDMRHDLFAHVEKLSFRFFDNQRVGQLVSRIVGDVGEIREMIFLAPNYLFVCIFMMLGTMVMLFYINWQLAIFVNILLVGKAYDSMSTNRKMKKAGRAAREGVGNMNAQTPESLNAIRLVQSFTNEMNGCLAILLVNSIAGPTRNGFALISIWGVLFARLSATVTARHCWKIPLLQANASVQSSLLWATNRCPSSSVWEWTKRRTPLTLPRCVVIAVRILSPCIFAHASRCTQDKPTTRCWRILPTLGYRYLPTVTSRHATITYS